MSAGHPGAIVSRVTDKWKIIRLSRAGLNEEFVPPCIEGLKGFGVIDVVDKHTAVSAAVERDA